MALDIWAKLPKRAKPPEGAITSRDYADRYGISETASRNFLGREFRKGYLEKGSFVQGGRLTTFYWLKSTQGTKSTKEKKEGK